MLTSVPTPRITSANLPVRHAAAASPRGRLASDLHPDKEVRSQQKSEEGRDAENAYSLTALPPRMPLETRAAAALVIHRRTDRGARG
jgi:hypothetical protein